MTTQQKRRKRALRRDHRKGRWHAFFSQEAFDMSPGFWMNDDGSISLTTRANVYHRRNGAAVLITMVARNRSSIYLWKDKRYLGKVDRWGKCIFHPEDPRAGMSWN